MTAQAMGIGSGYDGCFQQTVMAMNGFQYVHKEGDKLQVLIRVLAWGDEVNACVGA